MYNDEKRTWHNTGCGQSAVLSLLGHSACILINGVFKQNKNKDDVSQIENR